MVDTIESGIVPLVPINAGDTLPARMSRGKHVSTSAYICVKRYTHQPLSLSSGRPLAWLLTLRKRSDGL